MRPFHHDPGDAPNASPPTSPRPPPKSGLERHILRRLHGARIPEPLVNTLIADQEVDLDFPHSRLVVELDGSQRHQSPRRLERDRIKDAILQRHGCAVLRITEERAATDLDGAIDDIIALARARAAESAAAQQPGQRDQQPR